MSRQHNQYIFNFENTRFLSRSTASRIWNPRQFAGEWSIIWKWSDLPTKVKLKDSNDLKLSRCFSCSVKWRRRGKVHYWVTHIGYCPSCWKVCYNEGMLFKYLWRNKISAATNKTVLYIIKQSQRKHFSWNTFLG